MARADLPEAVGPATHSMGEGSSTWLTVARMVSWLYVTIQDYE